MIDPQIPEGIRSRLIKTFVRHIQDHPILAAQIKTWKIFDGDAEDHSIIPVANCPGIQITYGAPGQYPATFASTKADITINIELIVPGSNQFTLLDFWEVIEAAVDQFGTLDAKLRTAASDTGIAILGAATIGQPAINHAKYKNPPAMVGTGSVNVTLSIRR